MDIEPLIDSELALAGKKIVLTRASHQAKEFSERLREAGAIPIGIPTIEIVPPLDGGTKIQDALNHLDLYNGLSLLLPTEWIGFFLLNHN